MMTPEFMRGTRAPLVFVSAFAALATLAACGTKDNAQPDSRQVELTPAPAVQPQLADTASSAAAQTAEPMPAPRAKATAPKAPVPRRAPQAAAPVAEPAVAPQPAAAPAPAPARAATGVIAGGVSMNTTMASRVCTNTYKVGDRVTSTLESSLPGTNGAMIPAGATVTLRVSESQRGENGKEGIRLAFEPVSVTFGGSTYAISGTAVMTQMETVRAQSTGDQAKKVGAGAVIGAIAGELLGRKAKTAVVGAAVGAAAGGVIAAGTADWNACLGAGSALTITLGAPVTVKVGATGL